MQTEVYERPREKLIRGGVDTLSTIELIQLIIGSGTPVASSAKLARLVGILVEQNAVTLTALCEIKGVGHAKACQIIAALELGRRAG